MIFDHSYYISESLGIMVNKRVNRMSVFYWAKQRPSVPLLPKEEIPYIR